jgi:hypothetical protein
MVIDDHERPGSADPLSKCERPMPNLFSSPIDDSTESADERPAPAPPGSRPPLVRDPPSPPDGVLPVANVDPAPTRDPDRANLDGSRSLDERDHEMIDFLVQKAIETCTPRRPEPPSPPGARQRSNSRKP